MKLENTIPDVVTLGDVVISVSHVSKSYKLYPSHQDRLKEALHPFRKRYHEEFSALTDVSFEIRRGESVGILGRNGAGKSTLLQLIAGVLIPTSGSVKVAGSISALLELGAGFNPDLTGRENVVLANTIQGADDKDIAERVSLVEAFADVGLFFDQPMKVYSSGMYARVAFAHAINVNPDVLIVDEILGVGDAKFQEKCYARLGELRANGVCILFVSHSVEAIQRNCGRSILIDGGRVLIDGKADLAIAKYHDLLNGSGMNKVKILASERHDPVNRSCPDGKTSDDNAFKSLDKCFVGAIKNKAHYYNSNERRLGNGDAEIVDFLVAAAGSFEFTTLSGQEVLNIIVNVKYARDVARPRIGWALVTTEGMTLAGANTDMSGIQLPKATISSLWTYEISISLNLCKGEYFLNLGVADADANNFLDIRRSVIHLTVDSSVQNTGYFRIPWACSVISVPSIDRGGDIA